MKKEIFIPIAVAGLTVAFLTVSFFVFASKGNHRLVAIKIKIGALLLSLGAVSAGCYESTTCYVPIMPNQFRIEGQRYYDTIMVESGQKYIVKGLIDFRKGDEFSYLLEDTEENEIEKGAIPPLDGKYNDSREEFEINLNSGLEAGVYYLFLFQGKIDEQHKELNRYEKFVLKIY